MEGDPRSSDTEVIKPQYFGLVFAAQSCILGVFLEESEMKVNIFK